MDVLFDDEPGFLRVRLKGLWVIPKKSPLTKPILDECKARKRDLLLIDFTGVENKRLSLVERFRLGMSALDFAGKLRRIAAIGRPELVDRQRFGEMVARNRGINIRVFTNAEEATRWLLADDK